MCQWRSGVPGWWVWWRSWGEAVHWLEDSAVIAAGLPAISLRIWASGKDKDTSRDTFAFSSSLSLSSSLSFVFLSSALFICFSIISFPLNFIYLSCMFHLFLSFLCFSSLLLTHFYFSSVHLCFSDPIFHPFSYFLSVSLNSPHTSHFPVFIRHFSAMIPTFSLPCLSSPVNSFFHFLPFLQNVLHWRYLWLYFLQFLRHRSLVLQLLSALCWSFYRSHWIYLISVMTDEMVVCVSNRLQHRLLNYINNDE